ncbi:MAG TPA: crotonase/enoyl-CoA hydratase family protein [Tepidiformaceae bacterium]|nr:crotonase/enoyl-CoA hydratase family protein [Tepidiformaceae bacterium]
MAYEHIAYDVKDRILTITLDRPEQLNAFTGTMQNELIDACERADADDDIRVIIVTGRGRGFCAGADLSGGPNTFDAGSRGHATDISEYRDGGGRVTLRFFELKKPIIAAINGPAVGVGITMTLAMDIRLARENARMGFVFARRGIVPEVGAATTTPPARNTRFASETARMGFVFPRRGIVPEACSSWFLPRIVGIQQAMEWVATGRVFTAQEAHAARLVRSLHSQDELLPAAHALAREIADNTSGVSVALGRQLMWRGLTAAHPMHAHMADSRGILYMGGTPDVREGVASFLEKRAPNFTMSVASDLPDLFPNYKVPEFQ